MVGTAERVSPEQVQDSARRHLWMNFTPLSTEDVPVIVAGEGCYVRDAQGRRYLDGLSALFCVNLGHGRADLAEAGYRQATRLAYFNTWSHVHPPAAQLAERIARLAPPGLNRTFFTSGGAEAVESAIKLARQYHKLTGKPTKTKLIARETAYHGTTFGALTATGVTALREPFEPLVPGGAHVPNTDTYRAPPGSENDFADAVAARIEFEGPDTVAAVILEPVQNAGGCITPPDGYFQRVRQICDQYGVLLIADEVICSWGRLGEWFGGSRFGCEPDLITTAKGLTSGYAPMGAVIAHDRVVEPFAREMFTHGFTFGGHPVSAAVALANIAALEAEDVLGHVRRNEALFERTLRGLLDIPIVGDVRGAGYFWAIELVRDQATKASFDAEERERLLRGFLSPELFRRGLICRTDDRGEPVIQLAPPLIAGPREFEQIAAVLRPVLEAAADRVLNSGMAA